MLRQLSRLFVTLVLALPSLLGAQSGENPKDPAPAPRIEVPRVVRMLAAARNGVIPAIRKGGVIFLPRQLGVRSWRRGM